MIIKKLIIKSFGKFNNETVELKNGLNLIVGENESGKSTLHTFIQSMFYGFYKPNIRNKKTTELYDKYLPWDNPNDFSGVMILEDGRELRIERSFLKTNDSVRVFDNITGEELTEQYPYDTITKTYQLGLHHLGMSLSAYMNTVSIHQMGSKTNSELVMEIKENVINLGETKRVDVSLSNVLRKIADKKSEIGTERSKKSHLGRAKDSIMRIEAEKEDTERVWEEINRLKQQEIQLKERINALDKEKHDIEKKMALIKAKEDEGTAQKVKAVKTKLKLIEMELEKLKPIMNVSKEDVETAIRGIGQLEIMKQSAAAQKERLDEMKERIEAYTMELTEIQNAVVEIGLSEKISRDVYKYEEFENSKRYAAQSSGQEHIEELKTRLAQEKKTKSLRGLLSTIALVLTIICFICKAIELFGEMFLADKVLGITMSEVYKVLRSMTLGTWVGLVAFLAITIILNVTSKGIKTNIKYLVLQISQMEEEITLAQNRIKEISEKQVAILEKYRVSDFEALQALRDKKVKEELMYQENFDRSKQIDENKKQSHQKYQEESEAYEQQLEQIKHTEESIKRVMSQLSVSTVEELTEVLRQQEKYLLLEKEKESKLDLLQEMARGRSALYEESDHSVSAHSFYADETDMDMAQLNNSFDSGMENLSESYRELEERLREINDEILSENKAISRVSAEIITKESGVRKPALLEEELKKSYEEYEQLTYKLGVYEMIEEAIHTISENIQNNFAPKLNESISKIIAIATDYKYTDIKIDSQMNISVLDTESNKLVNVNDLSAGTLDLMYFALRLSIAKIMSPDKNLPIILDDTFVQYDDRRLVKVLEFLAKFDHQVLLFTCHKRELTFLRRMSADINVVNL